MTTVRPTDLTEPQWLLLRHLHQCNAPFYTEPICEQFSKHQIDRMSFYRIFFSLATYSYIEWNGYGEEVPGWKQDFQYTITPKGKKTIARYTQVDEEAPISKPLSKPKVKGVVAAYLAKTIQLKDYSFKY